MNVLSIFEGTIGSIRSVFRHKQRSFSLVAGMILGAGILGGIFIYTDIVNQANFTSIVKGVDYEVRFDMKTIPSATNNFSLTQIQNTIKQNPLVSDAIIMYGQNAPASQTSSGTTVHYQYTLDAYFPTTNGNSQAIRSVSDILGIQAFLLNSSDIGSSPIIGNLANNILEGSFSFKTNSSSEVGVVIPQSLADADQLRVGSTTNITLYITGGPTQFGGAQYNLTNVVVNGVYRQSTNSGNIFANIFNQDKIYLSFNQVASQAPGIQSRLDSQGMKFIATKINPANLDLSDSAKASSEIDQFINSIVKQYQGLIVGTNEITTQLLGSQIFSLFIVLFDLFLTLPVFILGVYLITFGAQMALTDRKKEIAIFKIQGASAQQIMKSVFGEIIVLIIIGSILGYIVSVLVGLSNSLAIGYGKFDFGPNFSKLTTALSYISFNWVAFGIIVIFGGGLLLLIGYHRSKGFIEAEIASTLYKTSEKEQSFVFKYWLDYVLFGIGVTSLFKGLANQYIFPAGQGILNYSPYTVILIDIPGPIFFWLGGALFISRLARVIPSKIDKYVLKLRYLSDVRVMIFADLRRRTINTSRIALIIALAISFAVLASVQGTTHEVSIDRQVTWQVGADLQVQLTNPAYGSIIESYLGSSLGVSGITSVLALGKLPGGILNDPVNVYFTNVSRYSQSPYVQSDAFRFGSFNDFKNSTLDAFVGANEMESAQLNVGDMINMSVIMLHYNGTSFLTTEVVTPIKVVGSLDHTPGGITSNDVLVDYHFIQNLYNATPENEFLAYNTVANASIISKNLNMTITPDLLKNYYPADTFLIQTSKNADTVQSEILANMGSFNTNVLNIFTFNSKLADARNLSSSGFGIAGLLTSMFLISLLCATIGVFIFVSLLVRSRSKEFAILRAVGSTKGQIYKIALSEVISVLIFALISGVLLGLGLSYMFNGFFALMNELSGSLTYNLPRLLVYPWDQIGWSMIITSIIIVIATILPTRRVANQEIIEETRQV